MMPQLLELSGTAREMGLAQGYALADKIRLYTEERVTLSGESAWSGHSLPRAEIIALAEACIFAHRCYAPDLMQELEGISEATGLSLAELIIGNGFTDFIDLVYAQQSAISSTARAEDDCTAFIIPNGLSAEGQGYLGQTWDMHASSAPHVLLIRGHPLGQPAFLAFSLSGCVGMIGMNDAGIAIGINNLLGAGGQVGVTWPFVVRKVLQQTSIDAALACITEAPLVGAHNFLLFDRAGNGINIEAMPGHCEIQHMESEFIVHSNHCLIETTGNLCRPRAPASQASSELRLHRANQMLQGKQISVDTLMQVTRDPQICIEGRSPQDMATCGAVIMQPGKRKLWALQGLPTKGQFTEYTV